ncbi:MAG: nitroreductase family protein, partial [Magnetococcus sp. WYHC-3]
EAARWSPSCYNDQPWHFVVANRSDDAGFQRILGCLVPFNQGWAHTAGALVVGVARQAFRHNGQLNAWAGYDLGQAMAAMAFQAVHMGLWTHQMGGFDPVACRTALEIPPGLDPVVVMAVGRTGNPAQLPADLVDQENGPRQRLPLSGMVHRGRFGVAPGDWD